MYKCSTLLTAIITMGSHIDEHVASLSLQPISLAVALCCFNLMAKLQVHVHTSNSKAVYTTIIVQCLELNEFVLNSRNYCVLRSDFIFYQTAFR